MFDRIILILALFGAVVSVLAMIAIAAALWRGRRDEDDSQLAGLRRLVPPRDREERHP